MALGPGQPKPARKRNRKRKRRVISDSSSEDSSSSTSSDASTPQDTVTIPVRQSKLVTSENANTDESDGDESTSSDEPKDDGSGSDEDVGMTARMSKHDRFESLQQRDSPSPSNVDTPPFIPKNAPEDEQALKEKFRKFWMASIAEGFKDDLEEIRKEPNLTTPRLALLIESLASGADVFSSTSTNGVNEMEVVLDQL